MQTHTEPSDKSDKRVRGRTDKQGQEAAIEISIIKQRIDELVRLKRKADDTAEDFSEAITKAAEDSGLLASELRKFVTARAGDHFKEAKKKVEQLALMFEVVSG